MELGKDIIEHISVFITFKMKISNKTHDNIFPVDVKFAYKRYYITNK